MVPALILSSDSHVFEPPDLWTTRIDARFRVGRPGCSGSAGPTSSWSRRIRSSRVSAHLERRCAVRGPRDDLRSGALRRRAAGRVRPDQHLRDMELDGVAGESCTHPRASFTSE